MKAAPEDHQAARRAVRAELIESTPGANASGHWLLASPILLFLAWTWTDIFAYYSPIAVFAVDVVVALAAFSVIVVVPLGYAAHRLVTALPRLFQHAGWDVQPLEQVRAGEAYSVTYRYEARRRASITLPRVLMRAAQGWVYIEIASIFAGAVLMVPIFFSVTEFGFGR